MNWIGRATQYRKALNNPEGQRANKRPRHVFSAAGPINPIIERRTSNNQEQTSLEDQYSKPYQVVHQYDAAFSLYGPIVKLQLWQMELDKVKTAQVEIQVTPANNNETADSPHNTPYHSAQASPSKSTTSTNTSKSVSSTKTNTPSPHANNEPSASSKLQENHFTSSNTRSSDDTSVPLRSPSTPSPIDTSGDSSSEDEGVTSTYF